MSGLLDAFKAPEDISTTGHLIDFLFMYTTAMNIVFFSLVCVGLFGFSYKYYYKRHPKPLYTHGTQKKQILITTVIGVAVFFGIDMTITSISNQDLLKTFWNFPKAGEDHIKVEVLAQQWMWNFRQAGVDGEFNTGDDILNNHELHVPVGKKIEFRVTAKDVIHSFFIPNTRLKVDAIPGRVTRMWVELTKTGVYDIACAEMCGTHHYLMKAKLFVHTQEEYEQWKTQAQSLALTGNDTENPDFYWGWKWGNE
jgi:cytochrome c oxidase subunit 2